MELESYDNVAEALEQAITAPFAMWTAFPSSDYYGGSAPYYNVCWSPQPPQREL